MYKKIVFLVMIVVFSGFGNPVRKELKMYIEFLSADRLQGRETGTIYEEEAADYIKGVFQSMGLEPNGENGTYFQDFDFLRGRSLGPDNYLKIDNKVLTLSKDFAPLSFSSTGKIHGFTVYCDTETATPNKENIHHKGNLGHSEDIFLFDISNFLDSNKGIVWNYEFLHKIAVESQAAGAKAIVFYNCDQGTYEMLSDLNEPIPLLNIPVVLLLHPAFIDNGKMQEIELRVDLNDDKRVGRNVLGRMDNGADNTVVIGAHYDHIGVSNGQVSGNGDLENRVNNGADDNASGVALMMVLARQFSAQQYKIHNYLFIAFSGEEEGLLGSNYFINHPTLDLSDINFMINLDQIGRMNPKEKTLIINGTGTSPAWQPFLQEINPREVSIKTNQSGVSLRDHTSFYLEDIPVLDFYTGMNKDYHQPTDDPSKINYKGLAIIFDVISKINSSEDFSEKIGFTKTSDSQEIIKYLQRQAGYSLGYSN